MTLCKCVENYDSHWRVKKVWINHCSQTYWQPLILICISQTQALNSNFLKWLSIYIWLNIFIYFKNWQQTVCNVWRVNCAWMHELKAGKFEISCAIWVAGRKSWWDNGIRVLPQFGAIQRMGQLPLKRNNRMPLF